MKIYDLGKTLNHKSEEIIYIEFRLETNEDEARLLYILSIMMKDVYGKKLAKPGQSLTRHKRSVLIYNNATEMIGYKIKKICKGEPAE